MNNQKKILQFKLSKNLVEKLKQQKSLVVDCLKNGLDIVLNDSRINVNFNKDSKAEVPTAVYYNNNGSNLHFLGEAIPASTSVTNKPVPENKKSQLDIPRSDNISTSSPLPSTKQLKVPTKKPSTPISSTTSPSIKKQKSTPSNNIPSTPSSSLTTQSRVATTPQQKTPKPSPNKKSEEKYSIKTRILQRLALQPWSFTEIVKSIDRTQQEKCDQLEVKHILETAAIPIKKGERNKYCLKPTLYKDIQIWEWPFYSSSEKITVADNAKEAYDLLGIDTDRKNLYHPDSPYKPPPSPAPRLSPSNNRKSTPQLHRRPTPTTVSTPLTPARNSPQSKIKRPHSPAESPRRQKPASVRPTSPYQKPQKTSKLKKSPPEIPIKKSSPTESLRTPKSIKTPVRKSPPEPSSKNSPADTFILPPKRPSSSLARKESPQKPSPTPTTTTTKKLPPAEAPPLPIKKPVPPSQKAKSSSSSQPVKKQAAKSLPNGKVASKRKLEQEEDEVHAVKKPASVPPAPKRPIEPVNIKTQREFDAYCHNFHKAQLDYTRVKQFFKSNFPEYVEVLQNTAPPTGTKRSYYDLNVEYHNMIQTNFLKKNKGKEDQLREAEKILEECNNKRRRLNYMWASIKQNYEEHKYTLK